MPSDVDDDAAFLDGLAQELGDDLSGSIVGSEASASTKPKAPAATAGPKADGKPPSKTPSKAPSVAPEDSGLGFSISGDMAHTAGGRADSKPPSKAPSKAPSVAPEDSLGMSLSGEGSILTPSKPSLSKPASKVPSIVGSSRPATAGAATGTPSRPSPRGSEVGAAGPGPGSTAATPRATPPASTGAGRPSSPSYHSDDFADILGASGDSTTAKSAASLPRTPQQPLPAVSTAGSARTPPLAQTGGVPTPSYGSSEFATPTASATPTGRGVGFTLTGTLGAPEFTDSPNASRRASAAGAATFSRRVQPHQSGEVGSSGRVSKRMEVKCDIPTPFELFRLYDKNNDGSVTIAEFARMLRDLDGAPTHFPKEEDPEWRLEGLRARMQRKQEALKRWEAKRDASLEQEQTSPEAMREMEDAIKVLKGVILEIQDKITRDEHKAAKLLGQPTDPDDSDQEDLDPADLVTPDVRKRRIAWRKFVEEEFDRADLGGSGGAILSLDEFYMYFYGKLCFRFPVTRTGVNPGAALFNIFVKYCSFGRGAAGGRSEDMLGHQFSKLCRDAGLVNGKTVTKATIDIIYHRARAADEALDTYTHKAGVAATARMYYPQFLFALNNLAEKRKSGFQEVVARMLSAVDSLPEPSFADFIIMSGHELERGEELPEFLLRPRALPSNRGSLRSMADNDLMRKMKEESQTALLLSTGMLAASKTAQGGGTKAFLDAKRTAGNTVAVPAPATPNTKAGASASCSYSHDADQEGAPASAASSVSASGGSGLRKSVYLGLPEGTLTEAALRRKEWERPEPGALRDSRAEVAEKGEHPVHAAYMMHEVRSLDPDTLMVGLKRVFEAYAGWGGGVDRSSMDKVRFGKALRDCLLVAESGPLPARKVDAVYCKVLPASCRAINFIQFIEALRHVALHHRLALNEVMERLVAVGGPRTGP